MPRRAAVALLLALAALFGLAPGASAHASLLLTDPANGAGLEAMPAAVTLTFSQPQLSLGSAVTVTGPGGVVSAGGLEFVDREVRQRIRPGAPEGTYTVDWRTTSVDGHVISGRFGFTVGAATGALPTATTSVDEQGGGVPAIVWVLIGAGVLVVVAGTLLALRRPPTRAADEEAADEEAADKEPLSWQDTGERDRQDSPPG